MDWRRRVARWRLADTTASNPSTTLNRRSTSATIRVCSARRRRIVSGLAFPFFLNFRLSLLQTLIAPTECFAQSLLVLAGLIKDMCVPNDALLDADRCAETWNWLLSFPTLLKC